MAVSVGTMQLTLSIAIMQVPTSVAIMQVLKFYCNYVGGTKLEVSAAFMQVKVFAANMWVTSFIVIMRVGVCCNHGGSILGSALCTWLCLL